MPSPSGLGRHPKRVRDLGERCLLRFAHQYTAKAEKPALLGRLGDVPTDLAKPVLESGCIGRCLGVNQRPSLPQRLDAARLNLGGLAAGELLLQAVSRDAL